MQAFLIQVVDSILWAYSFLNFYRKVALKKIILWMVGNLNDKTVDLFVWRPTSDAPNYPNIVKAFDLTNYAPITNKFNLYASHYWDSSSNSISDIDDFALALKCNRIVAIMWINKGPGDSLAHFQKWLQSNLYILYIDFSLKNCVKHNISMDSPPFSDEDLLFGALDFD